VANKYPYVASPGPLSKVVEHLRKRSFPKEVTAETLKKLGVAPKNESYVINVLRFLGLIDDAGKKVEANATAFVQHKDEEFQKLFEQVVEQAYSELFALYGTAAWDMDRASLTQFFRSSDHSTDIVGSRQAGTFLTLAALSGHGDKPITKESSPRKSATPVSAPKAEKAAAGTRKETPVKSHAEASPRISEQRVGLTVRIEVNIPADGDQKTYDAIFSSIRKNFIDSE